MMQFLQKELFPRENTLEFIKFFAHSYRSVKLADGTQLDLMLN